MYRVFFIDQDCFAEINFESLSDALSYAYGRGEEVNILRDDRLCASWGPVSGFAQYY